MLIGNQTSANRLNTHQFGGGVADGSFDRLRKNGSRNNIFLSPTYYEYAATPFGALAPIAILFPKTPGGISSINTAEAELTGGIYLALGKGFEASSSAALTGSASFQVTLPITASSSSNLSGSVSISTANFFVSSGSSSLSGSVSVGAKISFVCSGSASLSGSAIPRQLLYIVAAGGVSSELSPENLTRQVWSAIASENNIAGTMGEKLNDAGSASNPWTEVLTSGGYTAAELMRMFAAVLGGRSTVTFLGGVTYEVNFESVDQDDKIVVDATVVNGDRTEIDLDLTE